MDLPDKRETWEFLRADSRLFHLLELYLQDQRRQLLDRFPSQRSADEFFRLQAQVAFLDLLSGSLRGDLRAFYIGLIDREAP